MLKIIMDDLLSFNFSIKKKCFLQLSYATNF